MQKLDARGRANVLKPRVSVSQTKCVASKIEVDIEEIEDAIGKED